eukprot:scaffold3678_cov355-Prasinococcus_capsulatus_cf.AAC.5
MAVEASTQSCVVAETACTSKGLLSPTGNTAVVNENALTSPGFDADSKKEKPSSSRSESGSIDRMLMDSKSPSVMRREKPESSTSDCTTSSASTTLSEMLSLSKKTTTSARHQAPLSRTKA